MYWHTRDGDRLLISEMETSHIENCIAMLERKMPVNENDETVCADFPESMDWQPNCYVEPGAKRFREKIAEFKKELERRK